MNRDSDPIMLTVTQMAQILKIARGKAYEMVHAGTLPSIRFGRSWRVPRHRLLEWIDANSAPRRDLQTDQKVVG